MDYRGLSPTERAIDVSITPPIWATWYAYLLYFAVACGAIISIIKVYKYTKKRNLKPITAEVVKEPKEVIVDSEDMLTAEDKAFIEKITTFVTENMHRQDFVTNDLCDYTGLSATILNRKLRSLQGVTANVFIRTLRLKRAATLLRTGRYSVIDVTYDVGFSDRRYFRQRFMDEYGVLPTEYKKQQDEREKQEYILRY